MNKLMKLLDKLKLFQIPQLNNNINIKYKTNYKFKIIIKKIWILLNKISLMKLNLI